MALADMVTGVALALFSLFMGRESWLLLQDSLQMGNPWFKSAGLVPAITAALLLLCALALCRKALGKLRLREALAEWRQTVRRDPVAVRSPFLVFIWLCLYMLAILPLLPYPLATFLFLLLLMGITKNLFRHCLIAGSFSAALALVFADFFAIPLP
jgi:hypothetical protein